MKEAEVSKLADEIAEETFRFFSDKFGKMITDMERSVKQQEAVISNLVKLESRLKILEQHFNDHINNFRIVAVETERLISEKYEELSKRDESYATTIAGDMQRLRESIITLNNEISKLKVDKQGKEIITTNQYTK